jgi:MFS family permease
MQIHHRFFGFLHNKELGELYACLALRSFAMAMISIFIPIYLLNLGYSFQTVLIYYAILSFTHALVTIPAAKLGSRIGFKHLMLISMFFIIAHFLLLYSLETYDFWLYIIPILYGIHSALFWTGYHVDFAKSSDQKHRGREVGFIKIITSLVHVIGPLAGGLIIAFLGFHILFIICIIIFIFAALPLFMTKDIHDPFNFSIREVFLEQKKGSFVGYIGHGFESTINHVIWPIFVFFFIISDFTVLGSIYSVSLIFGLIFTFIVGIFSDNHRYLVMKIGSVLNSIIWIFRIFIRTSGQVFLVDSFIGISRTLLYVPYDALSYDKAANQGIVNHIVFREMTINLAGAVVLLIVLSFSSIYSAFALASLSSLFFLFF